MRDAPPDTEIYRRRLSSGELATHRVLKPPCYAPGLESRTQDEAARRKLSSIYYARRGCFGGCVRLGRFRHARPRSKATEA